MMPSTRVQVTVRPLKQTDASVLQSACWPYLKQDDVQEKIARTLTMARKGNVWPVVGMYGERVVAYGQLGRWQTGVEISDLIVGGAWRGKGIGTAMIYHLIEVARGLDFDKIEVGVANRNLRARELYERLGFTKVEQTRTLDVGNGPEDVTYLSLALNGSDD